MNYLALGMLLAEEPSKGPDYGKASPVGLLVVVLLLIGVFFLVRSMNRQLRKVPASFDETGTPGGEEATSADDAQPAATDSEAPPRDATG